MIAHDGRIAIGATRVVLPLGHIVWVYGAVQEPLKGDDGCCERWPPYVSVLNGHENVIDAHGSHSIEKPFILLHFLQASKVAFLEHLPRVTEWSEYSCCSKP